MIDIRDLIDGVGHIEGDYALAVLISISALLTYTRVAFEPRRFKWTAARLLTALGFTIWAGRFWWTLLNGGDVIVAPISQIAIAMVCCGYSLTQMLALCRTKEWNETRVYCLQDPSQRCHREDRIRDARKK